MNDKKRAVREQNNETCDIPLTGISRFILFSLYLGNKSVNKRKMEEEEEEDIIAGFFVRVLHVSFKQCFWGETNLFPKKYGFLKLRQRHISHISKNTL